MRPKSFEGKQELETDSFSDRDYNLWILLNHTRHAIYRARELELSQYGLTAEQGRLLYVVQVLGDAATPTEIAKHVFRVSHTISSLVDRMEKKGLVRRERDSHNKKIVRIALTAMGQDLLSQVTKRESLHKIMEGLSETKRKQMQSALEILLRRAISSLEDSQRAYRGKLG
jgi:DNA-binding MarR family transcriptional regulator